MNAYQNLEKKDNRLVIDSKKCEIVYQSKSEKKRYNLRLKMDNQIYYFKGNGFYSYDKSELICDEIASQVGLNTIHPVAAYFVDSNGNYIEGILSKDYLEDRKNTEVISGYQFLHLYNQMLLGQKFDIHKFFNTVLTKDEMTHLKIYNNLQAYKKSIKLFAQSLQNFNPNFKLEVDKELIKDLSKYFIFYFLTNNEDCYAHNIEFILKKTNENTIKMSLAPLTDNSISLLLKSFKFDYKNLPENLSSKELENKLESIYNVVNMPLSVFEKRNVKFHRESIAVELAKLIMQNDSLKEFYNQMKSIDLEKCLANLKQTKQYQFISDYDIKIAKMTYEHAIKQVEIGLEVTKFLFPTTSQKPSNLEKSI